MRISNKTHTKIRLNNRDTVILSSSVIPGNERAVQKLKDNLSRQGARIIHYRTAEVHSTGHAYRDETLWIHRQIRPKFFMPLHGYHYMLRVHADVAKEAGRTGKSVPDVVLERGIMSADELAESFLVVCRDEGEHARRLVAAGGLDERLP